MRVSSRYGVSLLELLVVVAIVALMIGLLLPAIQKVRSAAARINEMNKLRQMGLAVNSFAGAHSGRLPDLEGRQPSGGDSVLGELLPYLEGIDRKKSLSARYYQPAYFRSSYDPSFAIPSPREDAGDCSYAVNALAFRGGPPLGAGFPDGTSNTIGISHHYARCGITAFSSVLPRYGCLDEQDREVPCNNPSIRSATFADSRSDDVQPVTYGNPPATRPSAPGRTFQLRPALDECDYRVPQALSASGLMVCMLDGSVRTAAPAVSTNLFWGAVTPAGGEVLGDW